MSTQAELRYDGVLGILVVIQVVPLSSMTVTTIDNIILTHIRHVTTNFGYYNIRIQVYILQIYHG